MEKVQLDYGAKKDAKHFLRCFDAVRKLKMYWNKWITAIEQLLTENRLTKLAIPTIFRWMKALGFKYEVRRKIYYVHGHEKPEMKKYR